MRGKTSARFGLSSTVRVSARSMRPCASCRSSGSTNVGNTARMPSLHDFRGDGRPCAHKLICRRSTTLTIDILAPQLARLWRHAQDATSAVSQCLQHRLRCAISSGGGPKSSSNSKTCKFLHLVPSALFPGLAATLRLTSFTNSAKSIATDVSPGCTPRHTSLFASPRRRPSARWGDSKGHLHYFT